MSFFNLTQLGADDAVKASVAVKSTPNRTAASNGRQSAVSSRFGETVLPNSEANGSHEKYTTMLQKHQRSPNDGKPMWKNWDRKLVCCQFQYTGPNEIYNKPVTTNMKYGWWMKDGVEKESWTATERHACVHSEMTRFVDEMTLTNREFTLF